MRKTFLSVLAFVALLAASVSAQTKLSYAAQKSFIPKDLGKVYLGMPLKDFASAIPLSKAEANGRFEFLELKIPFSKGNVESLTVRVSGISQEEKQELLFDETTNEKDDDGFDGGTTIERIESSKIPATAFVYSIVVGFKQSFDLKSYVVKTYGSDGEVHKADDQYHFFDIQWTKKTSDGLTWLIRSFHEGDSRSLQLHGRIDGTEWGLD